MKRTLVSISVVLSVSLAMPPSHAAFPGRNGKLAFAGFSNIYVANPDGTGVRKITNETGGRSTVPVWSPDGTKILFRCNGGVYAYAKRNEVCTMRAGGSDVRFITDNEVTEEDASWSPDGQHIVFIRNECLDSSRCPLQIWVMEADGSNERQLTNEPLESSFDPAWSPAGDTIAFSRDCDIWLMDSDGSNERNITGQYRSMTSRPCEMAPDWSPDGSKLAYMCSADAPDYCVSDWWQVWVMRPDGTRPRAVTKGKGGGGSPAWSPNGRRICFDGGPEDDIYTIRVDGTRPRRISRGKASRYSCSWQPR